jgi:hypothetical protein
VDDQWQSNFWGVGASTLTYSCVIGQRILIEWGCCPLVTKNVDIFQRASVVCCSAEMDGYRTSSTLLEGVCVEFVTSSTEVGLFFYTWKWLKKRNSCLKLVAHLYGALLIFLYFVSYFSFFKWDMRPKQRVMNPKISIKHEKRKPVRTL